MNDLTQYLEENYDKSIFDQMEKEGDARIFHLHGQRVISGQIKENKKYDLIFQPETGEEEEIPKLHVKFVYHKKYEEELKKLIKRDPRFKENKSTPIRTPSKRNHIKNKTLYPLMNKKTLLFFSTLEGEVFGGIIGGFTRYEITILGKKGVPVTLLRHAVYDVRDMRKKCYLKRAVETRKKSPRRSSQPAKITRPMHTGKNPRVLKSAPKKH